MFNIGEGVSYATVWQPEVQEKRVICNLTTSKKLKEPNAEGKEYENSNWNKAVFVGKAFNLAKDLEEKDRIKILSGNVDNRSYMGSDGNRRYFNNVVIFDFVKMATGEEIAHAASAPAKSNKGTQYAALDEEDTDLPY